MYLQVPKSFTWSYLCNQKYLVMSTPTGEIQLTVADSSAQPVFSYIYSTRVALSRYQAMYIITQYFNQVPYLANSSKPSGRLKLVVIQIQRMPQVMEGKPLDTTRSTRSTGLMQRTLTQVWLPMERHTVTAWAAEVSITLKGSCR